MNFILNIYDHSVMMHVKFPEDVIVCRKILPVDCLNIDEGRFTWIFTRMSIH